MRTNGYTKLNERFVEKFNVRFKHGSPPACLFTRWYIGIITIQSDNFTIFTDADGELGVFSEYCYIRK